MDNVELRKLQQHYSAIQNMSIRKDFWTLFNHINDQATRISWLEERQNVGDALTPEMFSEIKRRLHAVIEEADVEGIVEHYADDTQMLIEGIEEREVEIFRLKDLLSKTEKEAEYFRSQYYGKETFHD